MRNQFVPKYKFALREDLKNEKQFLPTRAEPKATGWDVRCAFKDRQSITLKPGDFAKIPLGFRGFCPEGWWYKLVPRSSTFGKKQLHALYGTIDETYEGELVFACQYISEGFNDSELVLNFGDAIGQIIPVRRQEMEVEEISNEEYDDRCAFRNGIRGTGGFGSTS